jgi:hypothetical protein
MRANRFGCKPSLPWVVSRVKRLFERRERRATGEQPDSHLRWLAAEELTNPERQLVAPAL